MPGTLLRKGTSTLYPNRKVHGFYVLDSVSFQLEPAIGSQSTYKEANSATSQQMSQDIGHLKPQSPIGRDKEKIEYYDRK